MKKVLYGVLGLYIVIAIIITIGLLNYNEHNLTELGGKVYIKAKDDLGSYHKGDLLVIKNRDNYQALDNVFYCALVDGASVCEVTYGKIDSMMSSFPTIDGEEVSTKLIIGVDKDVRAYPVLGSILNLLESRFGYLLIVVLPILLAFVYIVNSIIREVQKKKK